MAVYFVQAGNGDGPIKIGYTKNLIERIAAIKQSHSEFISVLKTYPDWDRGVERSLHKMFKPYRIKGEWYKPVNHIYGLIGLKPGHIPMTSWILKNFQPEK